MNKGFKKIKDELNNVPPGLKDNIKNNINFENIKTNKPKNKFSTLFAPLLSALLTIAIVLSICMPIFMKDSSNKIVNSNTYLTISINPSIELEADENDCVINQKPLNEDGVLLLLKENLIGLSINKATLKIMQLANEFGFLNNNSNVKIHVENKDLNIEQTKYDLVKNEIDNYSKSLLLNLSISELTEDEFENILDLYDENKLDVYEKQQLEEFRKDLMKMVNEKENELRRIILLIEPYANNKDNEQTILNIDSIKLEIKNYAKKYNFSLKDFDIENLTYADMYEINHELHDDLESIEEINDELIAGADEDDYEDLLEDLFDYIKDSMFKEDD